MTGQAFADVRRLWRPASLLAGLSEETLRRLDEVGQRLNVASGTYVVRQGEPSDSVMFLLDASVKVLARLAEPEDTLLALRGSGDAVGEIGAADGGPRSASVIACGARPAHILRVRAPDYLKLADGCPDLGSRMAAAMAFKLRAANRRRIAVSESDVLGRLAQLLSELVAEHGAPLDRSGTIITLDLTQAEMADLIGASEVSVQRAMRVLRQEGAMASSGKRPLVRDIEVLLRFARPGRPVI